MVLRVDFASVAREGGYGYVQPLVEVGHGVAEDGRGERRVGALGSKQRDEGAPARYAQMGEDVGIEPVHRSQGHEILAVATRQGALAAAQLVYVARAHAAQPHQQPHPLGAQDVVEVSIGVDVILAAKAHREPRHVAEAAMVLEVHGEHFEVLRRVDEDACRERPCEQQETALRV